MYTIQANESGTRSINVSDENLKTIRQFSLFQLLVDSSGIITEQSLDKLKLNLLTVFGNSRNQTSTPSPKAIKLLTFTQKCNIL